MSEKKKIEVINNYDDEIKCDVALAQVDEEGMRLYVATLQTSDDSRIAEINSKIFVPKETMLRFTYEIVNAVKEYGEKYDEKYSFASTEEENDDE